MGLILLSNGPRPGELHRGRSSTSALNKLQQAVDSGQIRRFTGNDYAQELAKGDIAACVGWSGDVIQLELRGREDPVRGAGRRA